LPIWKELLPYRQFDRFMDFITTKADPHGALKNQLTLAISKSERIYNETVGRENLCLRSGGSRRSQIFRGCLVFPKPRQHNRR
jgi:hypothetical protein